MNAKQDRLTKDFLKAIMTPADKTKPYDTEAEVVRIEGDTAWVHISGGVDETPVKLTIDAKTGDKVQVRVSGGDAWLVGNATAPPTDDTTALQARVTAIEADLNAKNAKQTADEAQAQASNASTMAQQAKTIADDTNQYFWYTSTGTDTGAHITEVPQDEFTDSTNPNYHTGGNLLARSNGIAVRNGLTEKAIFSENLVKVGSSEDGRVEIAPNGLSLYNNADGLVFDANTGIVEQTFSVTENTSHISGFPLNNSSIQVVIKVASSTATFTDTFTYNSTVQTQTHTVGTYTITVRYDGNKDITVTTSPISLTLYGYVNSVTYQSKSKLPTFKLGSDLQTNGGNQVVIGRYNVADTTSAFIIGNGDSSRSNALTVDWGGNVTASGKVTATNVPSQYETGRVSGTSVSASSYVDVEVAFTKTFASAPMVVCTIDSNSTSSALGSVSVAVLTGSVTTSGFTARLFNAGTGSRTPAIRWIAIS